MTDYVKQPAFLDEIQVGDRFNVQGRPTFVVTGRRVETYGEKVVYTLIGLDDEGNPASQQGLGSIPVVRYMVMPSKDQQP